MDRAGQKLALYFMVVVWGDDYVDMLLRIGLRCFLSPKNIPNLTNLRYSKFIFVTSKQDYTKISQSLIFKKLESYIEPLFIELGGEDESNVYCRMTLGYEKATELACKDNAYAIYLIPDCIVSDGTFKSLEKYASEGRDVVLVPGPRIIKEKFIDFVNSMHLAEDEPLVFPPRTLVEIGLPMLHSEFKNYNIVENGFTKTPHMVSWSIPNECGLLVRAFHWHPIMVNCQARKEAITFNKFDTIDGSFIKRNFLNLNQFLWEQDSDNMILYSMTQEQDRVEDGLVWNEDEKCKAVKNISQSNLVNELHKIHFYNTYKLHAGELNDNWIKAERVSLQLVNVVFTNTNVSRTTSKLFIKMRKGILSLLPNKSKNVLKQYYWKTRGAVSWCKSRLKSN